jgi:hypothetical protein
MRNIAATGSDPEVVSERSLTVTDQVGRELFGSYLLMKQTGGIDVATNQLIIERALSTMQHRVVTDFYTAPDFTVVQADQSALVAYMDLYVTMADELGSSKNNELQLLTDMLRKSITGESNQQEREQLLQAQLLYAQAEQTMLGGIVPDTLLDDHVAMTNGFAFLSRMFGVMAGATQDPLLVTMYLQRFPGVLTSSQEANVSILRYLQEHIVV